MLRQTIHSARSRSSDYYIVMYQFFLATFGQANLCWIYRLFKCSEERRHPYAHER